MRFLPHFAVEEISGKQLGLHDGFLGRVHASLRGADTA
jgi:hypothetical protein